MFIWKSKFSSLQPVLSRVAAVKHLPVHHYSTDNILRSFGIIEFMSFENRVPLRPVLGAWPVLNFSLLTMNRLSKTEFAVFISLTRSLLPKDLTNQNLIISCSALSTLKDYCCARVGRLWILNNNYSSVYILFIIFIYI